MSVRVVPRLDIKGPNLVKGIRMEGLRVLGKPEDFARRYYEAGADELFYADAVASLYGRNGLLEIIERTAREIFIPLCVAGGLRSVDDVRTVLRAGADKVAINTAAIGRPQLISELARAFGSSTIVVAIEAHRRPDGTYEAYTDYGREPSGLDAHEWAKRAVELGAGELAVTAIARDGTGKGYDVELIRSIADSVPTPVMAHGGCGGADHALEVATDGRANAVCVASALHYDAVRAGELAAGDYEAEGNVQFLRGRGKAPVRGCSLSELKAGLLAGGVTCRP